MGGLHALFGCFGLIHFSLGLAILFDPSFFGGSGQNGASPPAFIGLIFAIIGGAFVLFGWALGVLTALSGRYIQQRKNRTFSIVVGCVNCIMIPMGTVLGVFDLVLLTNAEVIKEYQEKPTS